MEDISILRDKYDILLKKAETADAKGNYQLAKRNYMLAAETMLKIAKTSSPELRRVQIKRANDLVARADQMSDYSQPTRRVVPQKPANPTAPRGSNQDQVQEDEDKKEWFGAEIPNISFKDVAGLEDVKKTIMTRMINPLKYPEKYDEKLKFWRLNWLF